MGDSKGSRDLRQRHPQEVVQHDDRAMPGIEAQERRVEQIAIGEIAGDVVRRRRIDSLELDFERAPPALSVEVETGVDGQSVEPGVVSIEIT
jgi:hypothetical protein